MEIRRESIAQIFKAMLIGLVAFSCVYLISHIHISRYFPIKTVRVFGVNRVDRHEVEELVVPLVDHGFFTVNVDYIRDRLLQMPWVADTFVRRAWPDMIDITVIEKNPIARWNDQSLISDMGVLFSPNQDTYPPKLPQLVGPEGKQIEVLQYFNQMGRMFAPIRVKIAYLELTPYSTWKLILDNGMNLQMGRKDILTRLNHFVKVYPKIIGDRAPNVEYIDLRYSNGMAIRWKTPVKS